MHDQLHDPALGHLMQIFKAMPELEGFVKQASMDASEVDTLPETCFAWPSERRFPLHSAEHAALSYAYMKTASEPVPPQVLEAAKKALDVFGVPEAVFDTAKVAHEEDPADWLCADLKLFSVRTAAETRVAQDRLLENYEKLDVPHRKTAAENLVKRAKEQAVPVHPHLLKVAGLTVSHVPTMRDWVLARAEAALKTEFAPAFAKLAADLGALPTESRDTAALQKLAGAIAELDARAGLERFYDRKLPDPMLTVFNTNKLAAESLDIAGAMVPLSKLAAMPATFWADLGGQELSDEVAPGGRVDPQKLATVVETLPMDLKVVLRAQLRS